MYIVVGVVVPCADDVLAVAVTVNGSTQNILFSGYSATTSQLADPAFSTYARTISPDTFSAINMMLSIQVR
jgi:hypothetical protein